MAMLILMCISDPEGLKASRGERGLATSGERGQTVNLIHPGLLRLTEPWEKRSLYGDGGSDLQEGRGRMLGIG